MRFSCFFIAFINSEKNEDEEEKHIFLCLNLIASFALVSSEMKKKRNTFLLQLLPHFQCDRGVRVCVSVRVRECMF